MEKGQELFRQQVIDELNTKLNGEILLKPGISFKIFLICCVAWIVVTLFFYQKVTIESDQNVAGYLSKNNDNGYSANFFIPVDLLSQIHVDDEIPVQLKGISNSETIYSKIRIEKISQSLTLSNINTSATSAAALVKVDAQLIGSKVTVRNYQLTVTDGLEFSFSLNKESQKLLPWFNQHVLGNKQ